MVYKTQEYVQWGELPTGSSYGYEDFTFSTTDPQLHRSDQEFLLRHSFSEYVSRISLREIAVPSSDQDIRNLDSFGLTPITPLLPSLPTLTAAGGGIKFEEEGIKIHPQNEIFLDTRQAIGLTFNETVIAVAGAGIDEGSLKIVQIQDATGVRKPTKEEIEYGISKKPYYKTGLHEGMLWRDTLVQAWEIVGGFLNVPKIVIQSNENNTWGDVRNSGNKGYNDVAERMKYAFDPYTKNWIKYR